MEELTRLINDSGMDQAGWDELFGLVGQADGTEGAVVNGESNGAHMQVQVDQQQPRAAVDGQDATGQFGAGGGDWVFLNV